MKEILADPIAKWVYILTALVGLSVIVAPVSSIALAPFKMVLGYAFLFTLIARIVTTEARLRGVIVTLALAHLYLLAMNLEVLTEPRSSETTSMVRHFWVTAMTFRFRLCILIPCMVEVRSECQKIAVESTGVGSALAS